jgi:hypothetical protein
MAEARFHSIAKTLATIFNPAMADRGVYSVDYHNENGRLLIAKVRCLNLRADCHKPESSAGCVLGLV